jgi:6-phosphofructokinase 1
LAARCVNFLIDKALAGDPASAFIGLEAGGIQIHDVEEMPRLIDAENQRPKQQWWLHLRPIAQVLAQPGPEPEPASQAAQAHRAN